MIFISLQICEIKKLADTRLLGVCFFGLFVVDGYSGIYGSLRWFGGLDKIGALGRLILGFYVAV